MALCMAMFCFLIVIGCQSSQAEPSTSTSIIGLGQGLVQGFLKKSYNGRSYTAFEGIPFAEPPVGDLRFEPPVPASSWNGVLVANKSYICPQLYQSSTASGTEDCLYIYVYVPSHLLRPDSNLDVVVHIHGGTLSYGSPYQFAQPDYLMDKDLIMVTFNYRVSAAGFLSTGDDIVPGNNGFKDQNLALKWIRNNIIHFGGNPDSITLTGFAAGASSVQFHYISPLSHGLFHKGYSASYFVTNTGSLTLIPRKKAEQLAEKMECPTNSSVDMIQCLKQKPIEKLVEANIWFKPVVERPNENAFLPDYPYRLLKDKRVYDVPWVASDVMNESMYSVDYVFDNESALSDICKNFVEWGKTELDLEDYVDEDKLTSTLDKIKKFYLNNCNFTHDDGIRRVVKLMSDKHFFIGADISLRTQTNATKSPVHYYLFNFTTEDRLEFKGPPGPSHGVDIKLIIKFRTNPDKLKPKDEKMMHILTEFVANYARTGKPQIGDVEWIPQKRDQSTLNVLKINSPEDIKMIEVKELAPMAFWDSLPVKENAHLFPQDS